MWNRDQFRMRLGYLTPKKDIIQEIQRGKFPIKMYNRQVYIPNAPTEMQYEGETVFNIWRASADDSGCWRPSMVLGSRRLYVSRRTVTRLSLGLHGPVDVQTPEIKINFALLASERAGRWQGRARRDVAPDDRKSQRRRTNRRRSKEDLDGWQEGAQLAIINELCAAGPILWNDSSNRSRNKNYALKTKFGNAFSIPNHMNFFAMTNHRDALTLSDDDRRWLVLFSGSPTKPESYYEELFANIRDDVKLAAVMHYLMHRVDHAQPQRQGASHGRQGRDGATDHERYRKYI